MTPSVSQKIQFVCLHKKQCTENIQNFDTTFYFQPDLLYKALSVGLIYFVSNFKFQISRGQLEL